MTVVAHKITVILIVVSVQNFVEIEHFGGLVLDVSTYLELKLGKLHDGLKIEMGGWEA